MNYYDSMVNGFFEKLLEKAGVSKEELNGAAARLMDSAACRALEDIRTVLDDDSLDDPTCFRRIERIVEVYEDLGAGAGTRHDFG